VKFARRLWQRMLDSLPVTGFYFDRPIVLLQSDDWGRAGLRDQAGLEELRAAGLSLGERPYDFYTLETAEDLSALSAMLLQHRDSAGRHPRIVMNFIVENLDCRKALVQEGRLEFLPLADGLPDGWTRSNLLESYRAGVASGIFVPALHGTMHFCRTAVERAMAGDSERSRLLRILWQSGTPYIHWRMPWIGYEYWDPEQSESDRFLPLSTQRNLIGNAVGAFAKLFTALPHSACAPGYRANDDTHRAWSEHGIRVAQSGPGALMPPYFGRYDILHIARTVEFEPAVDAAFSVKTCVAQAARCFERGIPAIVSVHSINFQSTVQDFRTRTLQALDEFLTALECRYPDLLYLHDKELREAILAGSSNSGGGDAAPIVTKKKLMRSLAEPLES
jgi:hypothetical protein